MDSTVIKMRCSETTVKNSGAKDENGNPILNHYADLAVVWAKSKEDPNYIYMQLSGGTFMKLATINEAAAAIFVPGEEYMVTISKVPK